MDIIVFKEELSETHTVEPGVECIITSVDDTPAVEITSDGVDNTLRLWLSPNVKWVEYFDVIQYKHLTVVK